MLSSAEHENSNPLIINPIQVCKAVYYFQYFHFTSYLFLERIKQVLCSSLNFIQNQNLSIVSPRPRSEVIKIFMLISAEYEIINNHKHKNIKKINIFQAQIS